MSLFLNFLFESTLQKKYGKIVIDIIKITIVLLINFLKYIRILTKMMI